MRTLEDVVDPVEDSFITLRRVVHRTKSPIWIRLYACHRSSDMSARTKMLPDPSLLDMFLFNSFILYFTYVAVFFMCFLFSVSLSPDYSLGSHLRPATGGEASKNPDRRLK